MKAVNLLPSDLSGAPKASAAISARTDVPRGPGAFIVLGVLAFGVLALVGYVLTCNTIKDRQGDLAQLDARQQAASQRVTALKPYAEFDQLAKERIATVRDLAGQRFDWDQALRDLSRALPRDVTVNNLTGTLGSGDSTSSSSSAAATSGASITLTGCTRSQRSVARLMASLQSINGATSVRLANSQESEVQTAATNSASGGAQAPCGTGKRPDFNLVVGFGTAADATAAAPATGTQSATQPTTAAKSAAGAQASTASNSTSHEG